MCPCPLNDKSHINTYKQHAATIPTLMTTAEDTTMTLYKMKVYRVEPSDSVVDCVVVVTSEITNSSKCKCCFAHYKCFNVKLICYQFWCTRCAFRLLKSPQWCSGRKSSKFEKNVKTKRAVGWKPNWVPWNWAKSVEG
jgi:hypothetical protein